jgi:hypothetical protein
MCGKSTARLRADPKKHRIDENKAGLRKTVSRFGKIVPNDEVASNEFCVQNQTHHMKKLFLLGLVSLQLTANAQWTHVPNASSEDISVGSATQVLGVASGRVWYLDPVALTMSQSNVWNNFTQVTIAEDGTAWAKGQGGLYKATAVDGNNTVWNLGTTTQLNNISCRNAQQVLGTLGAGTNGQANIYTFDGTTMALLPGNGALGQVSIGTDGTIYGVYGTPASGNNVYSYTGSGWSLVQIAFNQISVGDATRIVGRYNGTPYYYDISVQGWFPFAKPNGSDVTDIEVAADGTIYALSSEWPNNVYRTTWGAVTGTGCPQLTTGPLGPTVSGPSTVCAGAQATFTAAADANATFYTWTLGNGWMGTSTTNSITLTVPNISGQQLAFSVTAGNDCYESAAASWSPVVLTEPAPFSITAPATACVGGSVALSTPATGETISWTVPNNWVQTSTYPNSNGGVFTAGESGDITFTKTNACFSRTETADVIVRLGPPAAPIVAVGSTVLCKDEPMLIALSYDSTSTVNQMVLPSNPAPWTFTALSDTSFEVTASGFFNGPFTGIYATANNACGSTTTELSLTANGESTSAGTYWQQVDNDLVVFGSLSTHDFKWLLEGNPIPGATGLTYTPLVSGNYALEATMLNFPCPPYTTASQYIEVLSVGVNEAAASSLNIYPNPFANEFVIEAASATQISVMNAMGEVVLSRTINGRTSIDASSFSSGIYFIREETSGAVMKLVKH